MEASSQERNRFRLRFGEPPERATIKLRKYLHPWVKEFISQSPFVVLASSDGEGMSTCTPRGGPPGFVRIIDDQTLLLPDVSGNFLFQSLSNLDKFPYVGLLFLIPGLTETARVSGEAAVVSAREFYRL